MADTEALADLIAERDRLRAELEKAHEARRMAQAESAALKDRMARVRLDFQREHADDVRELASALQTAVWRLDDMLRGDDGQAWKEAERAMPPLRALLAKHSRSKT